MKRNVTQDKLEKPRPHLPAVRHSALPPLRSAAYAAARHRPYPVRPINYPSSPRPHTPKILFIHKLRSSSPRLLFCHLHEGGNALAASSSHDEGGGHGEAQSPCAWLRSTAREIRDKWRTLVAWIRSRRRRRGQVAVAVAAASEFRYDPASYALNFEDDRNREWDGEFPVRNFSVRLPASPDRSPPGKMPTEEVAVARS